MTTVTVPFNPEDFSKEIPLLQVTWSANSLATLKTCPRKYYLEKICAWRGKRTSVHLEFGSHYADALEHYHLAIMKGMTDDEATISTVRFCLTRGTRDADGVFTPWDNEDGNKNRWTLVRAVVWYLDKFGANDPAKTVILADGTPAVELEFRFGTGVTSPCGTEYTLYGYIDRMVQFGRDIFATDNKTTKSTMSDHFFQQFNPSTQMTLYTTAGKLCFIDSVKGIMIDAVQLAVGFARFARHLTHRTERQLQEFLDGTVQWFRVAELFAQTGHYPMNESSCDKYGGCPFRGICGADPSVREMYLKSDFEQRVYKPRKARDAV